MGVTFDALRWALGRPTSFFECGLSALGVQWECGYGLCFVGGNLGGLTPPDPLPLKATLRYLLS